MPSCHLVKSLPLPLDATTRAKPNRTCEELYFAQDTRPLSPFLPGKPRTTNAQAKTDPPHDTDKRIPGYIEGYVRRFWQASQDHRGTPEAPGRVATLIERKHWETLTDAHPTAPVYCWGAAYRIPAVHVRQVKEYLDIREINGYSVDMAAFHVPVQAPESTATINVAHTNASSLAAADPAPIKCLVYIGLPSNPQFVGPQDPDALAEHIVQSRGPSGENTEYVYMLADALEELRRDAGVGQEVEVDEHVMDLARRVRAVEARQKHASSH